MEFTNTNAFFSGTASDFVEKKVTLNGVRLDAVTVNSLAKHGMLKQTGFGAKPARGRTPRMFSAINREGFEFGIEVAPVVDASTREFFAPETVTPETVSVEQAAVAEQTTAPETVSEQETVEPQDSAQTVILEAMEAAQSAGINVDYSEDAPF